MFRGGAVYTVAILSAAIVAAVVDAQNECLYTPNRNITAPDIAPATFAPSSYECCTRCGADPRCVAAVFSDFICHLKGSVAPQMDSMGPTVITKVGPSPPSTPTVAPASNTPLPSPPPPPPQPTTLPPSPPTPPPASNLTLVGITTCEYSSSCSITADSTCHTKVLREGICHASHTPGKSLLTQCFKTFVRKMEFSTADCTGSFTSNSYLLNKCQMQPDYKYKFAFCDSDAVPSLGTPIQRSACTMSCTSGCATTLYIDGQCQANSDGVSSTIAHCYLGGGIVTYTTFPSSTTCNTSTFHHTIAETNNLCWLDSNFNYITSSCGSSSPSTEVRLK